MDGEDLAAVVDIGRSLYVPLILSGHAIFRIMDFSRLSDKVILQTSVVCERSEVDQYTVPSSCL